MSIQPIRFGVYSAPQSTLSPKQPLSHTSGDQINIRFGGEKSGKLANAIFGENNDSKLPRYLTWSGLGLMFGGLLLSLGLSVHHDIQEDGDFELLAESAEDKFQSQKAGIPGLLVSLPGALLIPIGRGLREEQQARANDAAKKAEEGGEA